MVAIQKAVISLTLFGLFEKRKILEYQNVLTAEINIINEVFKYHKLLRCTVLLLHYCTYFMKRYWATFSVVDSIQMSLSTLEHLEKKRFGVCTGEVAQLAQCTPRISDKCLLIKRGFHNPD